MIKYDKLNNVQTFKINVVKSAFGKVRDRRIDALVSGDFTFLFPNKCSSRVSRIILNLLHTFFTAAL